MCGQKVENKNMEHVEVNKVVTIKCSFSLNTGPEGCVLQSGESKTVTVGNLTMNTALLFRMKRGTSVYIFIVFSSFSSTAHEHFNHRPVKNTENPAGQVTRAAKHSFCNQTPSLTFKFVS